METIQARIYRLKGRLMEWAYEWENTKSAIEPTLHQMEDMILTQYAAHVGQMLGKRNRVQQMIVDLEKAEGKTEENLTSAENGFGDLCETFHQLKKICRLA